MSNKLGFAAMDPEKQREIASKGGRTAHKIGRAHRFSHEEAVLAGRKGGQKRRENLMQPQSAPVTQPLAQSEQI
jgi:general stress protein YciG